MRILAIETATHGRVLVEDGGRNAEADALVVFHGYGQSGEETLQEVQRIPGAADWRLVSIQALHRFYSRNGERVVASWMTREDRELAIADNLAYVDRALDAAVGRDSTPRLVYIVFSQGTSMAYRAARFGRRQPAGVIALGGDIPPDVQAHDADRPWPRVLVGAGGDDPFYTAAKCEADEAFLRLRGVAHEVVRFEGGHAWLPAFTREAGRWLSSLST